MTLSQQLMEQLRKIRRQAHPLEVQCSVGISICLQSNLTDQHLYADTDRMLYQAKKTGRGRCCVQKLEYPFNQRLEEELV